MITQLLPDNDPDLKLARRIGRYLEGESSLSGTDDSLLAQLLQYKQYSDTLSAEATVPSAGIWQKIDRQTAGTADSRKQASSLSRKYIWAVAASLLIAAFAGLFYYLSLQEPVLLAESGSAIETVQLSDGSTVTLRPHSKLYEIEQSAETALFSLTGEAFFDVTSNPGRTFSVEAGNAKVSVLGTRFDLSSWGGSTQVYLEEGTIQFSSIQNQTSVILSPGQSSILSDSLEAPVVRAASAEEYTDWIDRQLVFTNRPARYVFNEVEQQFNISITAPANVMETQISSGGLSLEDRSVTLENLGLVLGGTFRPTGQNSYRFVAEN